MKASFIWWAAACKHVSRCNAVLACVQYTVLHASPPSHKLGSICCSCKQLYLYLRLSDTVHCTETKMDVMQKRFYNAKYM